MSYEVKVRHVSDTGDGISVEAKVEGEPVAHTFPKGLGFFNEPVDGKPKFVEKLEEKYEEKKEREGRIAKSSMTAEERKVQGSKFENKVYGENFKQEENQDSTMTQVDTSNPEEIRQYMKENMAEGYLSDEEGMNIDQFVDRYTELLNMQENLEEIVQEVYEGQVQ